MDTASGTSSPTFEVLLNPRWLVVVCQGMPRGYRVYSKTRAGEWRTTIVIKGTKRKLMQYLETHHVILTPHAKEQFDGLSDNPTFTRD